MVRPVLPAASVALLAAFCVACRPPEPEVPSLELLSFLQDGHDEVALNESLFFHFGSDIDLASVTSASVAVRGPDGSPAQGTLELAFARQLRFRPRLPRSVDLSDGGFLPGREYTVEFAGFPRPDGLRGRDGEILPRSLRFSFRTVERGEGASLFADPLPERPFPLVPQRTRLGPLDPIRLRCGEPLDPTTVSGDDFELRTFAERPDEGRRVLERIPVRADLVENRRDGALLELRPLVAGSLPNESAGLRALLPGEYYLHARGRDARLCSLGGRRVDAGWGPQPLVLLVSGPTVENRAVDLADAVLRGAEEVAGADGTALWRSGALGVRYPREAGDGRDGIVERWDGQNDVQASALAVPEGGVWDLSEASGLVVLRSQGALEVRGTLRRRTDERTPSIDESFRGGDRRVLADAGTLGEWRAAAREAGHDWTVLIAGGDLRVPGRVEVDGPLLLVAGGWIRVTGRVEAREAWKSPEGGANIVSRERVRDAPLRYVEPGKNPLARPLQYAVLSSPLRPDAAALRWRPAEVVGSSGSGRFRVRFLGMRDVGDEQVQVFGPLDDMTLLEDCQAVRFLIELYVEPGGDWDPPSVEEVRVSWTETAQRPERVEPAREGS